MARLHFERDFDAPVTDVFVALMRMLAFRRWDPGVYAADMQPLPRSGARYVRQTTTALREGRIVEIIRPVAVTLHETLHDPPCRVVLKLRWRIHFVTERTRLWLDLDYRLNQAATIRALHWRRRLESHCRKMLVLVARNIDSS